NSRRSGVLIELMRPLLKVSDQPQSAQAVISSPCTCASQLPDPLNTPFSADDLEKARLAPSGWRRVKRPSSVSRKLASNSGSSHPAPKYGEELARLELKLMISGTVSPCPNSRSPICSQ